MGLWVAEEAVSGQWILWSWEEDDGMSLLIYTDVRAWSLRLGIYSAVVRSRHRGLPDVGTLNTIP